MKSRVRVGNTFSTRLLAKQKHNIMTQLNIQPDVTEFSQGLMCCDQSGLCLKKKGDINPHHSGTYTAMMRLALQLDGLESSSVVISMETDKSATVIKQYDGHTVVMKVPASESVINLEKASGDQISDAPLTEMVNDSTE